MEVILGNLLVEVLFFVVNLWLVGFLIFCLNRAFYRLLGNSRALCYATGLIGTPIHELSHALACLLFGHKIREMRLFSIDRETGTLGYVTHTYSRKNLYAVAGNYVIGTAPIFMGTLFLWGMLRLLVPDSAEAVTDCLSELSLAVADGPSAEWLTAFPDAFLSMLWTVLRSVSEGFGGVFFFLLALCVAIHMNLSRADIRNSLGALPLILGILAALHGILFLASEQLYEGFVSFLHLAGSYLTGILLLSLVLSAVSVLLALLLRGLWALPRKLLGKKK